MKNNYDPRGGCCCPGAVPALSSSAFRSAFLLFILFALAFSGCTKYVARDDVPPPLANESFGEQVKVVMVPLPVIATSPNEGPMLGALTAFLLHNAKDEVSTLLAPQVNYNKNFGVTATLYGALYPEPGHSWEMNISKSVHVNEDYEVRYVDKHFLSEKVEGNGFVFYFTDGSARFFGFQSTSRRENETNYGDQELGTTLLAGYSIGDNLQVLVGERVRSVEIVQGAVTSVPFIRDRYTERQVPGINGFFAHAQRLGLFYSTLDSPTFPTNGIFARASVEISLRALGSDANYRHYEVEIKKYLPWPDDRFIAVIRGAYNQTLGEDVPFLERSILGGENTLRGYGRNRFVDSSYLLFNLEERIRLFRWEVFNVNADWELAPFLDVGAVAESLFDVRSKNLEFNPGIGFRATVKPNIVGRVDIGFGNEGAAVFVGLGYPF